MRLSRADDSLVAVWWFTIDRTLVTLVLTLVGIGLLVSLAASPAVAEAKHLPRYYFVERHVAFAALGLVVILTLSLLSPRMIRLLALAGFVVSIGLLVAVLVVGEEINGARRWLRIAGFSLQPSEFAKPCFVVLAAWAFAQSRLRNDMPALPIATALFVVLAVLLAVEPDVGQTLLVAAVWTCLFVIAGLSLAWIGGLLALGAAGLGVAYMSLPYVAMRIDRFLAAEPFKTSGALSQADRALQSFMQGGFLGRGPGEGTIKLVLPDAHTDYIFAVIAEEYGIIACIGLAVLFALIVVRAFQRAFGEQDLAVRYGIKGLALLVGLQAAINMGVNVGLLPAKGMTLPMISAGGSSMLATAVTFGMLLALARRRPGEARLKLPTLVVTPGDVPGDLEALSSGNLSQVKVGSADS